MSPSIFDAPRYGNAVDEGLITTTLDGSSVVKANERAGMDGFCRRHIRFGRNERNVYILAGLLPVMVADIGYFPPPPKNPRPGRAPQRHPACALDPVHFWRRDLHVWETFWTWIQFGCVWVAAEPCIKLWAHQWYKYIKHFGRSFWVVHMFYERWGIFNFIVSIDPCTTSATKLWGSRNIECDEPQ